MTPTASNSPQCFYPYILSLTIVLSIYALCEYMCGLAWHHLDILAHHNNSLLDFSALDFPQSCVDNDLIGAVTPYCMHQQGGVAETRDIVAV